MQHRHTGRRSVALVSLTAAALVTLLVFDAASADTSPPKPAPPKETVDDLITRSFQSWPAGKKPDVVLMLSGEQHSYIKFCGCSEPQYGGFERRYNFLTKLRELGWPVVSLDLGDLVLTKPGSVHEQTLLKYHASMRALEAIGYTAIGLGQNDFNLPLDGGIALFTQQRPDANPRLLAANFANRVQKYPDPFDTKKSLIGDYLVVPGKNGSASVGAYAIVANSLREGIQDKSVQFSNTEEVAKDIQTRLTAQPADLQVLLFQGNPTEAAATAKMFPQFRVILSKSMEEDPPSQPVMQGHTMIVNVGWRGRYVGMVGAFRTADGKDFDLHYQLVHMEPVLETAKEKEKDNPILSILQDYAQQVKADGLLAKYPKTPHPTQVKFPKATFVGTDICRKCHEPEFQVWKKSDHSHAFDCLVTRATKPTLRQFDGECVKCHVVGFEHTSGFTNEKDTPQLLNVGCESCHGPGSLHAMQKDNPQFRAELSPWRTQPTDRLHKFEGGEWKYDNAVLLRIDSMCQKCHDVDNDNDFKFERCWPKVDHSKGWQQRKQKPAK